MPRLKPANQLEALRRQQAEITAKLKEAETAERERKKLDEQRRHELAGRVILDLVGGKAGSTLAKPFYDALAAAVKRPADRALFALPPLPKAG